jgi:membrane-bound lytic murein transglycosylase B
LLAALVLAGSLGAPALSQTESPPEFSEWLEQVRRDALAAGIGAATVTQALDSLEPIPVVLERDRKQAEYTLSLSRYLERRLTRELVGRAQEEAREHRSLLVKVSDAYGPPSSILVAVWALESNFGRFSGVRPTIPVLATLAHDGRRAALFRNELIDALRILDRGDIELARMRGSWAGAMGQPQFLPSSYLKYAQDFDGDGRRDIWSSLPDVFASIGRYLETNGWERAHTWGRHVTIPTAAATRIASDAPLRAEGCRAIRSLTMPHPLEYWDRVGVRNPDGTRLPEVDLQASLLRGDGPSYLVYPNYEALLAYNCSNAYALSVALLADLLDGKPGPYPKAAAKKKIVKKKGVKKSTAKAPKKTTKKRATRR